MKLFPIISFFLIVSFFGCASSGPKSSAFSQESAPVSISQTLNSFSCPANNLRGSGVAANYDQALNYAISKIAEQIQSSVQSTSTMQTKSDVLADGTENITSSLDQQSQVSTELRNRQDVHILETITQNGTVGVVACMSKVDAAKPYREDFLKAKDDLQSSIAMLSTPHPLDKFANYEKATKAYSKYRGSFQILESLGLKEETLELEASYNKAIEEYIHFKSNYRVYIDGAYNTEEGKIIFEQISSDIKIQSLQESCEVGIILELEMSAPICKEGSLGISCTESFTLQGISCQGEAYFTLNGTAKAVGRKGEDEAKANLLKNLSNNEFVSEWKKEINRWVSR